MSKLYFFVSLFLLLSCTANESTDLHGIWLLEEVEIDGLASSFNAQYIEFKPDQIFAITSSSGDQIGIYRLDGKSLFFESPETKWYNQAWSMTRAGERLVLTGKGNYPRSNRDHEYHSLNTRLVFQPVERVTDNHAFINRVVGSWNLYKIREPHRTNLPSEPLHFIITDEGTYRLTQDGQTLEYGEAHINARHQKLVFKDEEWRIWFFGDEMRLDHPQMKLRYCLRKPGR